MTEQVPMTPPPGAHSAGLCGRSHRDRSLEPSSWVGEWNSSAALYVILAVAVAVINGISPSKACTDFIQGTTTVMSAVIVIGVAGPSTCWMDQAKIVDTIIHALANVFEEKAPLWCFCCSISSSSSSTSFVTSASGKAFILFPHAQAPGEYSWNQPAGGGHHLPAGDGFTNWFFPSSGLLMARVGAGRVTISSG